VLAAAQLLVGTARRGARTNCSITIAGEISFGFAMETTERIRERTQLGH
jgi:hypothetical protein